MAANKDGPLVVVDGLSVFHSVAGPAATLTNGWTYSFVVQLTSYMKRFKPRGVIICWDGGSYKRETILGSYKCTRVSSMNDVKRKYLEDVKRFVQVAGADQYFAQGWEADDIGAMIANTVEDVMLVSNDKDWLQLVRPGVSIFHKVKLEGRKGEKKVITHSKFAEFTGFTDPEEFVRCLCATGDGVDDIDGLVGIGMLTVKAYMMGIEKKVGPAAKKRLDEFFAGSDLYLRNRSLIELRDVREIPGLEITPGTYDPAAIKNLLEEFGFASMVAKFPTWVEPYQEAYADLSPIS